MARETNFGTRIDYFLITKGLLPWFKDGDILPSIKGSDHCPVFIDLYDHIVLENGQNFSLKEAMYGNREPKAPPRLAARYWPEYSGAQKLLSSFFGKKGQITKLSSERDGIVLPSSTDLNTKALPSPSESRLPKNSGTITPKDSDEEVLILPTELVTQESLMASLEPETTDSTSSNTQTRLQSPKVASTKRKKSRADSNYPAKGKKMKGVSNTSKKGSPSSSQTKLSSFFAAPSSSRVKSTKDRGSEKMDEIVDVDAIIDDAIAGEITPPQMCLSDDVSPSDATPLKKEESVQSWTKLFAKLEAPNCHVHNEPTRQFQVNKPGPNKGRTFFVCSRYVNRWSLCVGLILKPYAFFRPVGPGYDAGRDHRLREEVDPRYRCNFFKWTSEVRKATTRGEDDQTPL